MDPSPLVSVIIPAYNYGRFIYEALESVIAQTLTDWECIVVDDGSTDDTATVVAGYTQRDRRIRYTHQRNEGLSAARNTGLKHSTGKYVQFLDADDLIEAEKLEKQAAYLQQHTDVDIVYGSYYYFRGAKMSGTGDIAPVGKKSQGSPIKGCGKEALDVLFRTNFTVVSAPLVRRTLINRVGAFDKSLHALEDWDFWIRCALLGARFYHKDEDATFALIRYHPSSMSANRSRIIEAAVLMRRKKYLANTNRALGITAPSIYAQFSEWIGIEEILAGDRVAGSCHLLKAAAIGGTLKRRVRRLAYAAIALFVSTQRFRKIATSSMTHTLSSVFSRVKTGPTFKQ